MLYERTLKKIKDINDELKEFHPLLGELFRNLDSISSVEYKQGPRESGADFVLVKKDNIFNMDEYVGVVVKTGKITQNTQDVNTQIEQCATMKRTILGKKEILVNEIWVITSKGITQNAQDFFSQKYTNHKVKFIGPEMLTKLVIDTLPEYFESISIPINQYIQKTRDSVERLQNSTKLWFGGIDGLEITQELIYQERKNYSQKNGVKKKVKHVNIDSLISKTGVSLIEGGVGSGKSSLLRTTAIKYLDPNKFVESKMLPIYIQFKDFEKMYNFSLEKLIKLDSENFNDDKIKYLIMIDGVDESKHSIDERVKIIDKIISDADAKINVKLIMTSRKVNKNTLKTKLRSTIRTYEIAQLSTNQIINIIEKACSSLNTKSRILEDLKKSNLFRALPRTPIAAILLAKLLNENNKEIPSNLTELYSKYTEIALGRWDVDKELTKEKEFDAAEAITKNIAKYFLENDLLVISINEAKGFFKQYLDKRKMGVDPDALFNKIISRSEIFYTDDKNSTFGFRHRTFTEFFYAKNAISNGDFEITASSFDMQWLAVSFFWVGLQKDCPEVLTKFALTQASNERTKLLKLLNMGNILLAGYGTEYKIITNSIAQVFSEAGKFFTSIISSGGQSIFSNFSEMTLLCFFRHILADSYGYDFFSEAIEESMILIDDDNNLSDNEKIFSLFFLETSLSTPSEDELFKLLIEKYGNKLPLTITLGISHESRDRKIKGKRITKVLRSVRKLAESREVKQHIDFLYDKPIKLLNVK